MIDYHYSLRLVWLLLTALPVTLWISGCSLLIGSVLGGVITAGRLSGNRALAIFCQLYLRIVRSTPTVVLLFLLYYGLPPLLLTLGIDISNWSKISIGIVCFSLFNGAYFSEVMRAAYGAVALGQHEAAASIGMTKIQALRRIILPQACRVALPNLGNTLILSLKDTSVIFTLGVLDLLGKARLLSSNDYGLHKVQIFITVALFYWCLSLAVELAVSRLQRFFAPQGATH